MHGQCKSSNATNYMYMVRTDLEGSPDDALLNDWKQISCIVDFQIKCMDRYETNLIPKSPLAQEEDPVHSFM